jgi:alpha-L-arabinofuranosidase
MSKPVVIEVHSKKAAHQVSRHIYGHFAEHLGWGIYGGIYVGEENKEIPHQHGIRLDVVDALRQLRIPNLRWPGGCFADTYHWRHGIGPKEKRPAIVNTWWGGVSEDNTFGTHDFLDLCQMLQAEPFISANVGSGTVRDLMDWVQYVNHDGISPMAELRRSNGRDTAWGVKYWGLGNEMWGCGGNMRPEYYADLYRHFATFMTDWSNTTQIFRIASGPQSTDYRWTEVLMRDVPHKLMEGIGLHHYAVIDWNNKGPAANFSMEQYFQTMRVAWAMDEIVEKHAAIMDRYDPENRVALVVDEWGTWYDPEPGTNPGFLHQQNTMRDALVAGMTLNIFNNHSHRVRMANLAQAVNVLQAVLLVKGPMVIKTPTYHVMDLYKSHQDGRHIPVLFESPLYKVTDQSVPALNVSATSQSEGEAFITLVNIDPLAPATVRLLLDRDFNGVSITSLSSPDIQNGNSFQFPQRVIPKPFMDFRFRGSLLELDLPPACVVAVTFD